jgi:ABC-type multidrug transport system ATPase subunit
VLDVRDLTVTFPDTKTTALHAVNLRLRGEKMIVVGANGSGKTVLLRAILGLAPISSGEVTALASDVRRVRGEVGLSTNLADVYRLVSLPVRDLVRIFALLKGGDPEEVVRRLHEFGLDEVLGRRTYQLSTGQQKMVGNLLAVSFGPKVVLLDEPFDNVDFTRRRRFVRLLQDLPAEILLNTHDLDLLRQFTSWKLAFMFDGRLFGPFDAADLDRLFLSRGNIPGALAVMETGIGTFSVTRGAGDTPIRSATSLNALMEALA